MKANITVMNSRKLQVRALDSKLATFHMEKLVPRGQSLIRVFRTALGMTATQLAARLGISQPRVIKMEQNERNLKLSTMENIASAMSCRFVYAFVPEKSIEQTVKLQAEKKAKKMLSDTNQNMALENQLAPAEEIFSDLVEDLISNHVSKIWDE